MILKQKVDKSEDKTNMIQDTKNMTQEEIQQLYRSNMQFVYLYTFNNGKYYVGQTHKKSLRYGNASSYRKWSSQEMAQLMREKQYEKQILCFCDTIEEADRCEDYYINLYNSTKQGYNKQSGGKKGNKASQDSIRIMSDSKKGTLNPMYGRRGADAPCSKKVKLIDTKELTEVIYGSIKNILDDYPDWNYSSIKHTCQRNGLYQKRYRIVPVEITVNVNIDIGGTNYDRM